MIPVNPQNRLNDFQLRVLPSNADLYRLYGYKESDGLSNTERINFSSGQTKIDRLRDMAVSLLNELNSQDPGPQDPGPQDPGPQDPGPQDPGAQDPAS